MRKDSIAVDVASVKELREVRGGRKWDKKKGKADGVAMTFEQYATTDLTDVLVRHAERVSDCSDAIDLVWKDGQLKLKSVHLCHVRTCPICGWRRSLALKRVFAERFPVVAEENPTARYLFLTLTVKACPINSLRATLRDMSEGWKRLTNRRWLKPFLLGSIRAVEVTKSKTQFDSDGVACAHPHYHVILMVSSKYFDKKLPYYKATSEWVKEWQSAMRLDYTPVVWLNVCRRNTKKFKSASDDLLTDKLAKERLLFQTVTSGALEVLKYSVKDSDIYTGDSWYAEYDRQIPHLRFILGSGLLKNVITLDWKMTPEEPEEFEEKIESEDLEKVLTFFWDRSKGRYRRWEKK